MKKRIAAFLFMLLTLCFVGAQDFARDKKGLYEWTGYFVIDAAHILSDEEDTNLKKFLLDLNDETSVQIVVLTVPSLEGRSPHEFTVAHFDKWGVGDKEKDNGAILMVAMEEHEMFIVTGQGTEAVLTDALCSRILREILVPAFREGRYGQGIDETVQTMAAIITSDESLVASVYGSELSGKVTDFVRGGSVSSSYYREPRVVPAWEKTAGWIYLCVMAGALFLLCRKFSKQTKDLKKALKGEKE